MSLKAWIPSLNRAAQLHLLLESCERNAPGLFEFYINYDYTSPQFGEGYAKLFNSPVCGDNVVWQKRGAYGKDFYYFLTQHCQDDLFTHFVDDCIFYRKAIADEKDIRAILDEYEGGEMWGFNWRVGLDTTVNNHRERKPDQYPTSMVYSSLVTNWNYTEYKDMWSSYWAFPYSLDGFTYRVGDVLDYLSHVDMKEFTDPAQVEHHLCRSPKRESIYRPWMASPVFSNVFSNHLNSVHSRGYNPFDQFSISYEELNEKYLQGSRISLESMDFSRIQCGHEQISFDFIKGEA
jgi:hypothetical protein